MATELVTSVAVTDGQVTGGTSIGIGTGLAVSSGNLVTSGVGSVTSVTFTGDGTVLSSTPSGAVTSSGTLTASLNSQSANKVLAGPTSGAAANPTFRSLVLGDLPSGVVSVNANTANTTIDLSQGGVFLTTLNHNTTLSVSNGFTGASFCIVTVQGSGGPYTCTFFSTLLIPTGDSSPAVTNTGLAVDQFVFLQLNSTPDYLTKTVGNKFA